MKQTEKRSSFKKMNSRNGQKNQKKDLIKIQFQRRTFSVIIKVSFNFILFCEIKQIEQKQKFVFL